MRNRNTTAEELLVLACQAGEREAFGRLVRRFNGGLYYQALGLCGSEELAWDLVQECWEVALRGLARLEQPSAFPGWIRRVLHNRWVDRQRRGGRERSVREQSPELLPSPAPIPGPESLKRDSLNVALAQLSPAHRAVIGLHYGQDLSVAEIATALGLPQGTVKSRLHHARQHLKRHLQEEPHG